MPVHGGVSKEDIGGYESSTIESEGLPPQMVMDMAATVDGAPV